MTADVNSDEFANGHLPQALLPWIGLAIVMTVLQTIPDGGVMLRYDRAEIAAGEWWRLLSGNFIHLGWGHLVLNSAGLLVTGWLFAEDYTVAEWGGILVWCSVGVSLGLYAFDPQLLWCVGLSGALHGLFAAGAIALIMQGIALGRWLLLGEALKLTYERFFGAVPFSEASVGGAVVTDAHLWGALCGIIAGLALWLWRRGNARV